MILKSEIEAVLFAAGDAVPVSRLSLSFGVDEQVILLTAKELADEYVNEKRGIRLLFLEDRLQLSSAPECAESIIRTLEHRRKPSLSQPAIETLAVAAYFQPVTRAYIDQVRGVDSTYTVSSLLEKGFLEACGHLEAPGRPTLYRTTDAFLRTMNISSLDELPVLPDLSSDEGIQALNFRIDELKNAVNPDQISLSDA